MSKKVKSASFDAMVKFFMQNYNIPTKKDINRLIDKLDSIEDLIKTMQNGKKHPVSKSSHKKTLYVTASDKVLRIIKNTGSDGVSFSEIKDRTDYDDKKLRNIIYRMDKSGKITRKERGVYFIENVTA